MIFIFITYADYFNLTGYSSAGIGSAGKYAYFTCLVLVVLANLVHGSAKIRLDAPTILNGFTLASVLPLCIQLATDGDTNSYATAFVASLAFSVSIFYWDRAPLLDVEELCARLTAFLAVLVVLYTGMLAFVRFSGFSYFVPFINHPNQLKSNVFVAAIAITLLTKRGPWILPFCILLAAVSLILRPTSSLVLALAVALPVVVFVRRRMLVAAEALTVGVIAVAAVVPGLIYLSPDFAALIEHAESAVKSDALGGISTTGARLAIMQVAFTRVEEVSVLFGELFTGGTAVQVADVIPYWRANYSTGLAQIHSDYVCVFLQSGAVGYLFFNLALLRFSRDCFRGIAVSRNQFEVALLGTGLAMMLTLVVFASANPLFQSYQAAAPLWLFMFVAQVVAFRYSTWPRSRRVVSGLAATKGRDQLPKVVAGATFQDGIKLIERPSTRGA